MDKISNQILFASFLAASGLTASIYFVSKYDSDPNPNYKKSVKNIMKRSLIDKLLSRPNALQNPDSEKWKNLPLPTQEDLDSFGTRIDTNTLFKGLTSNGYKVIQRPTKTLKRVIQKADPAKLPKVQPYFKIHSDFTAFKTGCSYEDIDKVVNLIINDFKNNNKDVEYRIETNVFDPNAKDIIKRIYFYDETVSGSVIEYWVGHPAGLEMFRMNSYDRDHNDSEKKYPKFFKGKPSISDEIKDLILAGKPIDDYLKSKNIYKHFDFKSYF
jgi:hypothetical protein